MKPLFQIIADGEDATAKIADRLLSIMVIDEDGFSADRVEIELDDRGGLIALPDMKAVLDISLGTTPTDLSYMGRFVVSGIKGTFPVRKMTISAMAADMTGPIRDRKTRAWKDVTITDIANTIAGENGLSAQVGQSIANELFPFLAQHAESDLNFLTRVARMLDATAKPAGGYLVILKRGENVTAAGDPIIPVDITQGRLDDANWSLKEREIYQAVEAEWGDTDGGATQKVVAGTGDPKRRLRHVFLTSAEAQRAADAELAMAGRSRLSIDLKLAGFEPNVFAGGQVKISPEIRAVLGGPWHVKRVQHTLRKALTTHITAAKALAP